MLDPVYITQNEYSCFADWLEQLVLLKLQWLFLVLHAVVGQPNSACLIPMLHASRFPLQGFPVVTEA